MYEAGPTLAIAKPHWRDPLKRDRAGCSDAGLVAATERRSAMSRRRHTPEQIITAVREAEVGLANGKTVGQVSRGLAISEQTYYRGGGRSSVG